MCIAWVALIYSKLHWYSWILLAKKEFQGQNVLVIFLTFCKSAKGLCDLNWLCAGLFVAWVSLCCKKDCIFVFVSVCASIVIEIVFFLLGYWIPIYRSQERKSAVATCLPILDDCLLPNCNWDCIFVFVFLYSYLESICICSCIPGEKECSGHYLFANIGLLPNECITLHQFSFYPEILCKEAI